MFGNVSVRNSGIAIPGSMKPPPGYAEINAWGGYSPLEQLIGTVATVADGAPSWSYFPHFRDAYLRRFWKTEPILAGGLYSLQSRLATLGFSFLGKRRNMKKYYQDLAGHCDNEEGLSNVFARTVISLLTQDNGAFWYLHGAGSPDRKLRGRVTDIRFLDSAQCWRTLDPDYPVIYNNPLTGTFHRLHKTRVVTMSNMMQPDELGRKIGFCAVSRVLAAAQIIRDIRQYKQEKVGGKPSRGLLLMQGLNVKQLQGALSDNTEDADRIGYMRFKGVDTLTSINRELKGTLVDLASLPDGFNEMNDIQLYVYILALVTGVDAREFWPAIAAGATKADAELSHLKTQGKGVGDLLRLTSRAMNWHVIGEYAGTQFEHDFKDIEEEAKRADINSTKTNTYKTSVDAGSLLPEEMRALQIAEGIFDASVLSNLRSAQVYDDDSPVVDELEPEMNDIFELPEQEPEDGEDMTEPTDNEDENPPESPRNNANNGDQNVNRSNDTRRRARREKRADSSASPDIGDEDISWALSKLRQIL